MTELLRFLPKQLRSLPLLLGRDLGLLDLFRGVVLVLSVAVDPASQGIGLGGLLLQGFGLVGTENLPGAPELQHRHEDRILGPLHVAVRLLQRGCREDAVELGDVTIFQMLGGGTVVLHRRLHPLHRLSPHLGERGLRRCLRLDDESRLELPHVVPPRLKTKRGRHGDFPCLTPPHRDWTSPRRAPAG